MADSAARPLRARDKLTLLLALVPWLIARGRATVAEAAARFEVGEDAIRDAVYLIAVSGVPGDSSSYQHGDLFDIAWDEFEEHDTIFITNQVAIDDSPRFSAREASALIAGLQYLSAVPDNVDRDTIASLMAKLSRGASARPTPLAIATLESDATLAVIHDAVGRGRRLRFDYVTSYGTSERREVDPLRVESSDADWYLRAWCHTREALRVFRIDRITRASAADVAAVHRASDVRLPSTLFDSASADIEVAVEFPADIRSTVADYLGGATGPADDDDMIRATIRVEHFHGLKRLVAGLGGALQVLGPPQARAAVADWARDGLSRYSSE